MKHLIITLSLFTVLFPVRAPQATWKEFSSPEGGFLILLPRQPEMNKLTVRTKNGPVDAISFLAKDENANEFMVTYSEYPAMNLGASRAEKIFDGARDGVTAVQQGRLLSDTTVTLDTHPGRAIVVERPDGRIQKMVCYLVNHHFYQLSVETWRFKEDARSIDGFFNSFRLLPARQR